MKRVTIQYHQEGDSWWAESPDVPGFSAAAPNFNELRSRTLAALDEVLDGDAPFFIDEKPPVDRLPQWSNQPDTAAPESEKAHRELASA